MTPISIGLTAIIRCQAQVISKKDSRGKGREQQTNANIYA